MQSESKEGKLAWLTWSQLLDQILQKKRPDLPKDKSKFSHPGDPDDKVETDDYSFGDRPGEYNMRYSLILRATRTDIWSVELDCKPGAKRAGCRDPNETDIERAALGRFESGAIVSW